MILQPLVENAIKHGIEPNEGGGRIVVAVAVDAERMSVSVRDTGVGFKGAALSSAGSGIGLKNTDARLRKLFGEESELWTDTPESGGFEVGFSLPIIESAGR
jgi:sensor histidine kinase YesM